MTLSVKLNILGKFLDQPALVNRINKAIPPVLSAAGAAYVINDAVRAPEDKKESRFIQGASVMSFTIASALIATHGWKNTKGKHIIKGLIEEPHLHKKDIDEVLEKLNKTSDEQVKNLVNRVKDGKILKLIEVKNLHEGLKNTFKKEGMISKIIPDSHSHGPFAELGKLSLLGLVPVLGGILGGVVGDVLTKDNWKQKFPNKIKEGSYQYLNNIFLCNVGAGLAMIAMNRLNVQSKTARFTAMLIGVAGVGLIAGSAIANYIGKNFINPLFHKGPVKIAQPKMDFESRLKDLNSERHPEMLDLSLHIDDIASVGFLSGFKWIGPALPALYLVSGYRAGIGYRNGHEHGKVKQ